MRTVEIIPLIGTSDDHEDEVLPAVKAVVVHGRLQFGLVVP
jgi:hypothetical protein